jgi:BolA protein
LQDIKIEDKSFLHKKHLSNQEGKYHLRLSIKSSELKKQNKVQAYKKVYNIINEEIKKYIHSIQILIR